MTSVVELVIALFTGSELRAVLPLTERALSACSPRPDTLCIDDQPGDRRFSVQVDWSTSQGGAQAGHGTGVPLSGLGISSGGMFWFFSQTNPEMLTKIVNGCAVNGHFWVFESAGTNVGLTIRITDTRTGAVQTYLNPDLHAAAPVQDTQAFVCP